MNNNKRIKVEKEHKLICRLILSNDIQGIRKHYGNRENAEKRVLFLEHELNYGGNF